jgi:hypothetical protein
LLAHIQVLLPRPQSGRLRISSQIQGIQVASIPRFGKGLADPTHFFRAFTSGVQRKEGRSVPYGTEDARR